jgi:hypothetical protein
MAATAAATPKRAAAPIAPVWIAPPPVDVLVEASTDVTVAPAALVVVRVTDVTTREVVRLTLDEAPLAALLRELVAEDDRDEMEDEALAPAEVSVLVAALEASEARDDEMDDEAEEMDEERDDAELLRAELSLEALELALSVEPPATALVTVEPMFPPTEVREERIWA